MCLRYIGKQTGEILMRLIHDHHRIFDLVAGLDWGIGRAYVVHWVPVLSNIKTATRCESNRQLQL